MKKIILLLLLAYALFAKSIWTEEYKINSKLTEDSKKLQALEQAFNSKSRLKQLLKNTSAELLNQPYKVTTYENGKYSHKSRRNEYLLRNAYFSIKKKKTDMKIIGLIVNAGADIDNDFSNGKGQSILYEAVQKKNITHIKYILKLGARPRCETLAKAVEYFDTSIIKLFLDAGAETTDKECNVLRRATQRDFNQKKAKLLLDYGADSTFMAHRDKISVLHWANSNKSSIEDLKLLLSYKPDINALDKYNHKSPLFYAVDWKKMQHIKLLLENGADINFLDNYGKTPLIAATEASKYKMVKVLIENGADKSIRDDKGYTAMDYAQEKQNKGILAVLKTGSSGKVTGLDKALMKKKSKVNYNSFALVIGINEYMNETAVDYADNSAKSFKLLAQNVLGVPQENIIYLTNEKATSGQIKSNIELISQLLEEGSTLYFYYAGHGVPATNGKTYLLPSDMKADNIELENALAIANIYDRFAKSPAKDVIVFMDSCFSGKDDSGELLYKGVAPIFRNKKATIDKTKLSVFSAGSSSDFANQYKDEEQRMFSYFIIKGLLDGKKSSEELSNYVKMSVKRKSLRLGLSYKQVPQYEGKKSLIIVQ